MSEKIKHNLPIIREKKGQFMVDYYELADDEGVVFRCDVELDLIDDAPQEERPWLLWLFVKSDAPLSDTFSAFMEDLKNTLKATLDAVFAGTITKEGWVECYFYAPDGKRFENLTSEVMSRHGGFAHERGASRDSKWEMYLERLYPDAYAQLRIQNRHTVEALLEAGDDLTLAREIEHYLFFQTKSSMDRSIASLSPHGFVLKEEFKDDQNDYAYGAVLTKTESVTPEAVEASTALLFDAALEQHGLYEGWSTVLAA